MVEFKSVLFIAHDFPPSGGSGVQRSAKFVKYLPRLDWEPVVLTTRASSYEERDETLLNDLSPKTRILRTYSLEEWQGPFSPFTYVNTPFSIPDRANLWLPWALSEALKEIRSNPIRVIYATAPPFAAHILATILKVITKLPTILDYRDEWTLDPDRITSQSRHRRWFLPLERLQQKWVINKADRVLVVTESAREVFARKFGDLKKIVIVRNGYDTEDFIGAVNPILSPDKFHIVYTGNTARPVVKKLDTFFQGLSIAVERSVSLRDSIRVSFVGQMDEISRNQVSAFGLEPYVRREGYLPHLQSVGYLLAADVLLLISRSFQAFNSMGLAGKVVGKTYEYIGAGKPVLLLTPRDSETHRLVAQAGTAFWADPEDAEDIARMLIHLESLWRRGDLQVNPNKAFIQTLTRRSQAEHLTQILSEISS